MSETALPKAIVIAGAMIAIAVASGHMGFGGFLWGLIGVGAGCYIAWREFWGGEIPGLNRDDDGDDDPVADRFR